MNERVIKKMGDKYFVFFPSNGYFCMCSNEKDAKNVKNKIKKNSPINTSNSPIMYTIHITNRCNLQCKYCFSDSSLNGNTDMNKKTIKLIIEKIALSKTKKICIDFQGGEPLLCFELIEYALFLCQQLLKEKEITYTIQTNATLLTPKICEFLKINNFTVGISLDGPKHIHNKNRVYCNGNGSFDIVVEKINLLKRFNIPFSVISVVTDPAALYEMYNFFVANKIKKVKFVPVMPQGRAQKRMLNLKEYARVESDILMRDINSNDPVLLVSAYFMLRKMIYVDNSYMCMRNPCGAGIDIVSFDEYGNILPCDAMSGIDKKSSLILGNIYDSELDIKNTDLWKNITRTIDEQSSPCKVCIYKNICCGGCKSDTFNFYGSFNFASPLCEYYRNILDNYYSLLLCDHQKTLEYMKLFL